MINKTDICWNNYNNSISYKYEYNGLYYENCINGTLINDSENYIIDSDNNLNEYLCIDCNNGYYKVKNDNDDNIYAYIKCNESPIGYFLDGSKYKRCYYKCESCSIKGNDTINNCTKCNNDYSLEIKINNYYNCFEKKNKYKFKR